MQHMVEALCTNEFQINHTFASLCIATTSARSLTFWGIGGSQPSWFNHMAMLSALLFGIPMQYYVYSTGWDMPKLSGIIYFLYFHYNIM